MTSQKYLMWVCFGLFIGGSPILGLVAVGNAAEESGGRTFSTPLSATSDLANATQTEQFHGPTGSPSGSPLEVRAALSHALYTRSSPTRILLKVDLEGKLGVPSQRPPLNLAIVIDRSGSMAKDDTEHQAGSKFSHAMEAAHLVVENLSDKDIVSLIAFDERAVVLSPAGPAVNKNFLRYRLGQISAEGWTNLSAGLLEAFSQIDSKAAEGQLKHVIVLTDGEANRGVTALPRLQRMVQAAHTRGIGLSTLGCGTGYNEKLVTVLAESGGGRFTYMRSSEDIADAMATELNGLLEVVAQNVEIKITAVPDTRITRVFGRLPGDWRSPYDVDLGDIRNGEKSVFLFELEPQRFGVGGTVGADVALTWDNPDAGSRERKTFRVEATFSEDAKRTETAQDRGVFLYAGVLDALEQAEEAIQGLDTERFSTLSARFDRLYNDARSYAIESRDQDLLNQAFMLNHFMSELTAIQREGLLHDHRDARGRIDKEIDYRRYLLDHHRPQR